MAKRIPEFFLPVSIEYFTDEAVLEAGLDAAMLDMAAMIWCKAKRRQGVIPAKVMDTVCPFRIKKDSIQRLLDAGLWEVDGSSYRRRNWEKWNATLDEIEELSSKRSRAGKKGAEARWKSK